MLLRIEAWTQSDFLCRNYILNRLENNLYDIYSSYKTAKEVWEMLEKKYKTEDTGAKKFVIGKFLKYNMVDMTDPLPSDRKSVGNSTVTSQPSSLD